MKGEKYDRLKNVPRDENGKLCPVIRHIETNTHKLKERKMADFNAILSTRADTIEAPKSLPPGKYSATVKSFEPGISTQKKTPYVEVKFAVDSVIDVPSDLEGAAAAALSKGNVEMRTSYYLSEKATYRLIEFLGKDLGISTGTKSIGEMLTESVGQPVALILDTETSKDGREFVGIKRTAKI